MVARVPHVMQMEVTECGAACLTMICNYWGKYLPLSQVRLDCGVSRDGSSALDLVKTARSYGLEVESVTCDIDWLMHQASYPAIIHWGFDHYVVLDGFRLGKAVINDPARGRVRVSRKTLDKQFTGVCMCFKPGRNFQKEHQRPSVGHHIGQRIGLMKPLIALSVICSLIVGLLGILQPFFRQTFLDRILNGVAGGSEVRIFMLSFIMVALVEAVCSLVEQLVSRRLRDNLTVLGSVRFIWHSLMLPLEFFTQRYVADVAGRFDENEQVSDSIATWLGPLFVHTLMAGVYLVLMACFSMPLAAVGLVSTLVILLFTFLSMTVRSNYAENVTAEHARLLTIEVNGIGLIDTIKSLGAENSYYRGTFKTQSRMHKDCIRFLEKVSG